MKWPTIAFDLELNVCRSRVSVKAREKLCLEVWEFAVNQNPIRKVWSNIEWRLELVRAKSKCPLNVVGLEMMAHLINTITIVLILKFLPYWINCLTCFCTSGVVATYGHGRKNNPGCPLQICKTRTYHQ